MFRLRGNLVKCELQIIPGMLNIVHTKYDKQLKHTNNCGRRMKKADRSRQALTKTYIEKYNVRFLFKIV